ncbi:MAG: class I SAM-dependent methyltransferase [Candidatus Moranbacteria bacterium]|nr:class I SAM-dependent methyltransferase [Candidatus Moranbacteria bacterium]
MNRQELIKKIVSNSNSRLEFWINFINQLKLENICEIGVYKGDFAAEILKKCENINEYSMIDPWKHLDHWNKPANKDDETFNKFYDETIEKTNFAKEKRLILRGKTTEVIDKIPDKSLDFAYIDGDHTLKGITTDLIKVYPKIKDGGWIGGDDFSYNIWQHSPKFEPTLIFPFAVYFAEAISAKIFALPYNQFLIHKFSDGSSLVSG